MVCVHVRVCEREGRKAQTLVRGCKGYTTLAAHYPSEGCKCVLLLRYVQLKSSSVPSDIVGNPSRTKSFTHHRAAGYVEDDYDDDDVKPGYDRKQSSQSSCER
ncbi:50S ribosomal protein L22 [Anopheles sinensis]|uniref:50S ribosomal protein L22 n=1 Tax=Anopheles sinensis TaxID=74873 RepID=A0A084WFW0_ANOSI|nr:50S ribosomal protein L22 [Anopheles sinensis]